MTADSLESRSPAVIDRRYSAGCAPQSLEDFRQRINRHRCSSAKDDFFIIGIQRDAASPDWTVGIDQLIQRGDFAVIGNAPYPEAATTAFLISVVSSPVVSDCYDIAL